MTKKWIVTAFIAICALSSCLEKEVYQGPKDDEKEFNEFDFSTVHSATNLEVSYANCGIETNVYFEVYDEIPVTESEYGYTKKEDVTPLFAAYTDDNSVYKGDIDLPAYLKKVYIYSPAFFAQTLIEADVINGSIKATDTNISSLTARATESYVSYMCMDINSPGLPNAYKDARWKKWLGEYDGKGHIQYPLPTEDLIIPADKSKELYTVQTQVINITNTCPEAYRSYSDMLLNENAEISVTFLGQNTCWNCSMGYYYYKEGEKPGKLDEAHVIMLFPNTQDGLWGKDYGQREAAMNTAGIERGTVAQLMYYPNIATGSEEGKTTVFPAGYRIGLVLANNAWSNRVKGFGSDNQYRSATSKGMSIDNYGRVMNEPRTAVYRYGDCVMISFEDFTSDQNFSDVVVTMKSNPEKAIIDIPDVNPDSKYTTVELLKGIYAFEDLWPSKGDYDMNDVIVRYSYGKTFDKENYIYSESFTFKTFQNFAGNNNGLAFRIPGARNAESATCYIRKAGEKDFSETNFTYEKDDNVYLLTENVKENMGAEYKVTMKYASPILTPSEAQPFIFKNGADGKRWEVHIPKEKPTSKMDTSYFKQSDDASNTEQGIYYVREGNYPFAFFLSGANENDISKLLDSANEKKAIDLLYTGYIGWVTSNGKENQNWYKK